MDTADKTIRLTTAQAIIRYLAAQYIDIEGEKTRVCGGGFGIFGHGNVPCLGEALYDHRESCRCTAGKMSKAWGLPQRPTPNITCDKGLCFVRPRRDLERPIY